MKNTQEKECGNKHKRGIRKMNKELEALNEIEEILHNEVSDIPTALSCTKDIEILKKSLQALEIIKEKEVNIEILKATFEYENSIGYSMYAKVWCMDSLLTFDEKRKITPEQYDLLKEILR